MLVNYDSICCILASLNGSPKVPSNSDAVRGHSISFAGEAINYAFRTFYAAARDPQIIESADSSAATAPHEPEDDDVWVNTAPSKITFCKNYNSIYEFILIL
jgi:hypothetical protein